MQTSASTKCGLCLHFLGQPSQNILGDVILTATYIVHCKPALMLYGKTSFEVIFHQTLTYDHLRVFCYLYFAYTHHHKPSTFDTFSLCWTFLGYPYGTKGYQVYDLAIGKNFISRYVIFMNMFFIMLSLLLYPFHLSHPILRN